MGRAPERAQTVAGSGWWQNIEGRLCSKCNNSLFQHQTRGRSTAPALGEERRINGYSKHNKDTEQDGYCGVPCDCAQNLMPDQDVISI